jgi:hypothetical protein
MGHLNHFIFVSNIIDDCKLMDEHKFQYSLECAHIAAYWLQYSVVHHIIIDEVGKLFAGVLTG